MGSIIVESDNLLLVQALKSKSSIAEASPILQDIQLMIEDFHRCGFTWTPREGNELADLVAKLAASNELQPNWATNPPMQKAAREVKVWKNWLRKFLFLLSTARLFGRTLKRFRLAPTSQIHAVWAESGAVGFWFEA
ncbi:hypothetical protein PIB30_081501 [Stylosanthes scabra]|uniref:RNase H type-1 domain-containing protein n=1 Tax=Stylosanthes scabra TaxID=79078 RepID=A0ABU6QRU1_9FABA|nr:hypothetical protein [Stylosanthes scabra]